jgi:zinc-binding alcohol dehydrogenase/oxidoreductase
MKALVLAGKNEPLMFEDVPEPLATEGDTVLVKIKAAALNHRDVWIQKGQYAGIVYPIILGSDGAGILQGTTDEVIINAALHWGESAKGQGKNFKILGLPDNGTFAEYAKVPLENIVKKPKHLSFEQAAALPLAGVTAYRAVFTRANLKSGERVLISGIGGGVALFAMQFAIAAGCEVWVTSGDDTKIAKAIELGAKGGINYKNPTWAKDLLTQSSEPFDVIIDSSISEGFPEFVNLCNTGGRIVIYGATTLGTINNINPRPFFWKQLSLLGSTMGSPDDFSKMVKFVSKHKIVPVVDTVFALRDGNAAMKKMDEGKQFGKLVLSV